MSSFEDKHGNGETYKKYLRIAPLLSPEFKYLTFELMVETYIRDQMSRKYLSDIEFGILKARWHVLKDRDLGQYPYNMEVFPHAHPWTKKAAIEGKLRLGIS
jgi:hypothetical protein